jgi:hypothetical protein
LQSGEKMKGTRTYQILAALLVIALLSNMGDFSIPAISDSVDDLKGLIESVAAIYATLLTALKIIAPAPMLHEKKNV